MDYKGPSAAINRVAVEQRDKAFNLRSKVRSCTKKANTKAKVDGIENAMIASMNQRPEPTTVGSYGPKQGIRTWKKN
jgi:hypothetical protein